MKKKARCPGFKSRRARPDCKPGIRVWTFLVACSSWPPSRTRNSCAKRSGWPQGTRRHPSPLAIVLHEPAVLGKAPGEMSPQLGAPDRCPRMDAPESFVRYLTFRACGSRENVRGDEMIHLSAETFLLPAKSALPRRCLQVSMHFR